MRQGVREFRWTLHNEPWNQDTSQSAMRQLTAEVTYTAQGRDYTVRMSTLVDSTPPGKRKTPRCNENEKRNAECTCPLYAESVAQQASRITCLLRLHIDGNNARAGYLSIVLAGIGGVFYSAVRLRERTMAMIDESVPLQQAFNFIRHDLQGALPPGGGNLPLSGDFNSPP